MLPNTISTNDTGQLTLDKLDYKKQDFNTDRVCVGMIVLQTDEVVETEVRNWLPDHITLYHNRIRNEDNITEDTLLEMREQIPSVCTMFPKHAPISVVAYCCTSGATMIGESVVEQQVRQIYPTAKVTNPITAVKARLRNLGAKNIGLLTPYIPSVTQAMSTHLVDHGFTIVSAASFYEENDFNVCQISSQSIEQAVEHVTAQAKCDAVFASCTNLRTLDILDSMSAQHGIPVISSNAALAWHIAELGAY